MSIKNIKTKITLALISSVLISNSAFANGEQCAYLKLNSDSISNIRINHINGQPLFSGSKSYNQWQKAEYLKVKTGNLELVGAVLPNEIVKRKNKAPSHNQAEKIAPLYFALDVAPGTTYELSAVRRNGQVVDINLVTQSNTSCSVDGEYDTTEFTQSAASKTVSPTSKQLAIIEQFFTNVSVKSGMHFQSVMPAGMNSELDDSVEGAFIPRYQFAINSKPLGIVKYRPMPNQLKNKLDTLVVELSKTIPNTQDGTQITFDLSQTQFSQNELSINLLQQTTFLAQEKKTKRIYNKISKRFKNNPPSWWNDQYMALDGQMFPGGNAERRATNGG